MQSEGTAGTFLARRIWALGAEVQLQQSRLLVEEHNLIDLSRQSGISVTAASSSQQSLLAGRSEAFDPMYFRNELLAFQRDNMLVRSLAPSRVCFADPVYLWWL